MSIDSKIPVTICKFCTESIIEFRSRTLVSHISIRLCNLSIVIHIHKFILHRTTVRRILLLIGIVGIRSISYHLPAEIPSCALGYISSLDVVIIIIGHIEFCESGILECSIGTEMKAPVRSFDRYAADGEFKSLVADRSDVSHQFISEIRPHRHLHRIKQVIRITDISINASCKAFIEKSVVEAKIICRCCLPSYRRVVCLRRQHIHKTCRTHIILIIRIIGHIIAGKMDIVSYTVLLTCLTD